MVHVIGIYVFLVLSGWISITELYFNLLLWRTFLSGYNLLIHGKEPRSAQCTKLISWCVWSRALYPVCLIQINIHTHTYIHTYIHLDTNSSGNTISYYVNLWHLIWQNIECCLWLMIWWSHYDKSRWSLKVSQGKFTTDIASLFMRKGMPKNSNVLTLSVTTSKYPYVVLFHFRRGSL